MSVNPDISKQAYEVPILFLTLNNIPVAQTSSQKHLGM